MKIQKIYSWNKLHKNVLEFGNAKVGDKYIFSIEEARSIDDNMVKYEGEFITYQWNEYKYNPDEEVVSYYPNDFVITKKLSPNNK